MIGRRAGRQKRPHYDPFACGTVFWPFVSSILFYFILLFFSSGFANDIKTDETGQKFSWDKKKTDV